MTRKVLNLGDVGDSTHWGTDDADYINKYLTGSDQSATDPVTIATTTVFNSTKLVAQNIVNAGNTLTLPSIADTLVGRTTTDTLTNKTISGASNTITNIPDSALSANVDLLNNIQTVTAAETFNDGTLLLRNPANTFSATVKAGAQTAAQTFTFPVTASDTIDTISAATTLSNKTLNTFTIADANNIVLGSTTGTKIGTATTQKIGFLNATPAAQQTGGVLTAAVTYGANEQSMLQKAYNALRTFGLLS